MNTYGYRTDRLTAAGRHALHPLFLGCVLCCQAIAVPEAAVAQNWGWGYNPAPRPRQLEGNYWKNEQVYDGNGGYKNVKRLDGAAVDRDLLRVFQNGMDEYNYNQRNRQQRQVQPSYSRPQYIESRPQNIQPRPQYIESRPQYIESRPQYSESQPTERIISSRPVETVVSSETVVAPKPNVVKESPKSNDGLRSIFASLSLAQGSAADPLLAVSTQQTVNKVTDAVGDYVKNNGTPEMQEDWKKVVEGGSSAKDIAAWWAKHSANVNDPKIKELEGFHVNASKLVQDLEDGLIPNPGKKAAIDKLAELVSAMPATNPMRPALVADLGRMRQFQRLGELLDLASVAPDPIVPILQGTEMMGMPVMVVAEVLEIPLMQYPVGDAEPLPSSVNIRIVNPSTNSQSVNCSIGSRQVEMAPGTAESLSGSTSVAFDPGNGSRRSVSVTAGTWAWKIENGLWSLSKVTPKITIDNSKFKGVFHYTVNGKHASLAAGETAEHSNAMPIEIAFDRGNGSGTATKVLTFGSYAVGIDASSRGLELFRTDVQQVPPPSAAAKKTSPGQVQAGANPGERVRKALENAEKQKELTKLLQSLDQGKQ